MCVLVFHQFADAMFLRVDRSEKELWLLWTSPLLNNTYVQVPIIYNLGRTNTA